MARLKNGDRYLPAGHDASSPSCMFYFAGPWVKRDGTSIDGTGDLRGRPGCASVSTPHAESVVHVENRDATSPGSGPAVVPLVLAR
jgi:hypothetical protein